MPSTKKKFPKTRVTSDLEQQDSGAPKTEWVRGIHGTHERTCGIFRMTVNDLHPEYRTEMWHKFVGLYTPYDGVRKTLRTMRAAQMELERIVAGLCFGALEDLGDDIPDEHRAALIELLSRPRAKAVRS